MATGTVKWFNDQKGFGFIVDDETKADVFVHQSKIMMKGFRSLDTDDRVEYEIREGPKGPHACNVQLVTQPNTKKG